MNLVDEAVGDYLADTFGYTPEYSGFLLRGRTKYVTSRDEDNPEYTGRRAAPNDYKKLRKECDDE